MTTNASPSRVRIDLAFDRPLHPSGTRQLRFLVARIRAERPSIAQGPLRIPLDLALVLDTSGSMSGAPLAAARRAAEAVVARLHDEDTVSLVTFSDEATTHTSGMPLDVNGRYDVQSRLRALQAHGCTALADGWLAGAECVAEVRERSRRAQAAGEEPAGTRRAQVMVLSDGMGNVGEQNPETLGQWADGIRARDIVSSCVGVGEHYESAQLEAIALRGGGRFHHAAEADEIAEVVLGELDDVESTALLDAELELSIPRDLDFEVTGDLGVRRIDDDHVAVPLGSLIGGVERPVVVAVLASAPMGAPSDAPTDAPTRAHEPAGWRFEARLRGRDPLSAATVTSAPVAAILEVAGHGSEAERIEDRTLGMLAARAWQSDVVRRVVAWNRAGNLQASRDYLRVQLRAFGDYCELLPEARLLLDELQRLGRRARRPMSEMSRKELATAAYKLSVGEPDKRSAAHRRRHHDDDHDREEFGLRIVEGHVIADINGVRALIDTGSPLSFGNVPAVRILGRRFALGRDGGSRQRDGGSGRGGNGGLGGLGALGGLGVLDRLGDLGNLGALGGLGELANLGVLGALGGLGNPGAQGGLGALGDIGRDLFGRVVDVEDLGRRLGTRIDALVGTDILGELALELDIDNGRLVVAADARMLDVPRSGRAEAIDTLLGVPVVDATLDGRPLRAFLDTGAAQTYVTDASLLQGEPAGAVRDSYPMLGDFEAERRTARLRLGELDAELPVAVMPQMLAAMMAIGGCKMIVGTDLLRLGRVAVDLRGRRLWAAQYRAADARQRRAR